MESAEYYVKRAVADSENSRLLAGAAIAQFLAMREGLKGRIVDGGLDATAASLTAAVISSKQAVVNNDKPDSPTEIGCCTK